MAKVRNLSDNRQKVHSQEFDFYQQYVETLKTSELGTNSDFTPSSSRDGDIVGFFGQEKPKSLRVKRGEKVLLPS